MGLSGSFGGTPGVATFIWVCLVCMGAACVSLGSFVRWVRSGSSGSSGCAMGVAVVVRVRLVRMAEGCCVHGTVSSGCGLVVVWFVRVRLVRPGAPCGSLGSFGFDCCARVHFWGSLVGSFGFVWFRLVRPVVPWRSLSSFGFVSFVLVCLRGRWVRLGSSGSSRYAVGVSVFFQVSSGCAVAVTEFVSVR